MKRARTLSGLLFQYLGQRWDSLGKRGRILFVSVAVVLTAVGLQLAACAFGGCALGGPCGLEASSPCQRGAAQSDEPCPYEAERAREAALEADTPCHAR